MSWPADAMGFIRLHSFWSSVILIFSESETPFHMTNHFHVQSQGISVSSWNYFN